MTALVGCALVPIGVGSSGGLYPTGCSSLGFGLRQCAAIVDLALGETTRLPAGTVVLIRPPDAGQGISLGSHAIADVTVDDEDPGIRGTREIVERADVHASGRRHPRGALDDCRPTADR